MIIFYKVNYGPGNLILKIIMGGIITTQTFLCIYFFIKCSILKYRILSSLIWSGILFTVAANMWYLDFTCPERIWYKFNPHVIWHIGTAWSLFNTIQVTTVFRATINNTRFTWRPLIKYMPWFLFVVILSDEKSNTTHAYTSINLEEIKLLGRDDKRHRRVKTIG